MDNPDRAVTIVDHDDLGNFKGFHFLQDDHGQRPLAGSFGIPGHHHPGSGPGNVTRLLQQTTEIAVGDHTEKRPVGMHDAGAPEPFGGHLHNGIAQRNIALHAGDGSTLHHQFIHLQQQPFPERSARMKHGKILAPELPAIQKGNGKCIPQHQGDGRRRCRGKIQRACFVANRGIQDDVGLPGERGIGLPDQRDDRHPDPFEHRKENGHFVGVPALGKTYHHIVGPDNSQIAMHRIRRVKEDGRRAGGIHRRDNLPRNEARLPHAGDDHAPRAGVQEIHRTGKVRIDALFKIGDFFPFNPHDLPPFCDCFFSVRHEALTFGCALVLKHHECCWEWIIRSITSRTTPWPPSAVAT